MLAEFIAIDDVVFVQSPSPLLVSIRILVLPVGAWVEILVTLAVEITAPPEQFEETSIPSLRGVGREMY